jgi:DDE superfamily endonuclease
LRYFAGGRPEDIALVHGVSHSEVFRSIWRVVDAVLDCEELAFEFPSDHAKQKAIAASFQQKSVPQFDCCVGAIDGMLLWLEKPSPRECEFAGVGAKKFFCGRKHKFGLNMQGTCDSECRFLDVCIKHPAATSDFLSFTTSSLYRKLEEKDFLAPGLCIFGDAAYPNSRYFISPYKSVSSGTKDDFNFYHSQLRIKIECAFGQLVSRWGILRRPLPCKMGIMKATHLTKCLCRLHNYCINERIAGKEDTCIPRALASDTLQIMTNGGLSAATSNKDFETGEEQLAQDFVGGGHHNEDTSLPFRRQFERRSLGRNEVLPRERLHKHIADGGFKRPTPKKWQT